MSDGLIRLLGHEPRQCGLRKLAGVCVLHGHEEVDVRRVMLFPLARCSSRFSPYRSDAARFTTKSSQPSR